MHGSSRLLAATLLMAPLGAQAADLVVWWEKGCYAQEDEAVRETIAAFEQETGKQVELVQYSQAELAGQIDAALEAGQPPDFAIRLGCNLFLWPMGLRGPARRPLGRDPAVRQPVRPGRARRATLFDATTGRRALYALPMGFTTNHVHVWKSLLEQAGLHPRGHSQAVGGLLVVLVRPGAAGGAPRDRPRRHLGRRPAHVGRGETIHASNSSSSSRPTRPTT